MKTIKLTMLVALLMFGLTNSLTAQVSSFPHLSTFEVDLGDWVQSTFDDFDWTRDNLGTTSSGTGPQTAPYGANGTSWYIYTETSGTSNGQTAAVNCTYDFSALLTASMDFSYYMYALNYLPGKLRVKVNGTEVWSDSVSFNGYQLANINLDAYAGQASVVIEIESVVAATGTTFQSDNTVDEVNVTGTTSACTGIPTAGISSGDSSICVGDNFILTNSGATFAGGIVTQWQSSLDSINWTDITGATNANYTSTQTVPTYYQYMVICTATNDTVYSNMLFVNMNNPTACYCIPVSTYGCSVGDLIARVILNTLDNNTGTVCPSGTTGYSDYTQDTTLTTTLLPSTTYTCEVYAGQYAQGIAVWIDYNDDGFFDNNTERVGYGNIPSNASGTFPVTLSCTPPVGQHRMRVRSMYATTGINVDPCVTNFYGEVEDYTITIGNPPACPSPSMATVPAIGIDTAGLMWMLGCSSASQFDIEYGPLGFTPGTGTMLSAVSPTISNDTVTYTLTGLNSFTEYSVYIRAYCDSVNQSSWTSNTDFTTLCGVFNAPYWIDSVEGHATSYQVISSNCWDAVQPTGSFYDWNVTGTGTTGSLATGASAAHSGVKYFYTEASSGAAGDSTILYSPMINIDTASASLEFWYHMYGADMGSLYIEVYDTAWTVLDSIIGEQQTATTDPWLYRGVSLANYSGTIQVRFVAIKGGTSFNGDICLDDIAINICIPNPGTDGSADVCRLNPTIDLSSMITEGESTGTYQFPANPFILNGSTLIVSTLPVGTYEAYYVVNTACVSDTTTATFTVYGPSQAGNDAVDTLCRNEPYNLINSLSGTVDLGGYWIDPSNDTVSASITSSNLAGSYNYYYITGNGVCPDDSANVLIIVDGTCDYLSVNEGELSELTVYPNPTLGELNIFSSSITGVYSVEITDVNGRVVLSSEDLIKQNQNVSLDLSVYERGTYFVRVFNNNFERMYRVVRK